jgi:hypothetical protein
MVAESLTVADLAVRLNEILDRANEGEQFAIEEDGVVFAVISAPALDQASKDFPRPDPGFADDLERIQAKRPPMADPPEWPD